MHEVKKQIMNPFSTKNYNIAQRDDLSFVITHKTNSSHYIATFEAKEVKPLCGDLILVRRNFFSHWCVYSIPKKDYISLPIYNHIKAEGKYFIFERSGKFGIAIIAYDKFFEVTPPEYTCIIGITHGCIVFHEDETYGVHNIFSKYTITTKKPIKLSEKGNLFVDGVSIDYSLGLNPIKTDSLNCISVDKPFAKFHCKIKNKTVIYYLPLATAVYEHVGDIKIPDNGLEDFLLKELTK